MQTLLPMFWKDFYLVGSSKLVAPASWFLFYGRPGHKNQIRIAYVLEKKDLKSGPAFLGLKECWISNKDISLKNYNTFGIDAKAKFFCDITLIEGLRK